MASRRGDLDALGLAGVLVAKSVRWEDGAPVEAALATPKREADLARVVGAAGLARVRVLELGKPNTSFRPEWLRRVLFDAPLRGLVELRTLPAALLPELARATPPFALERIDTVGGKPPLAAELARAFADGGGLPALVELGLTFTAIGNHPPLYEWLATTPVGRRLRGLSMQVDATHLVPWHQRLVAWGDAIGLERVSFGSERTLTGRATDWIALVRERGAWSAAIGEVGHVGVMGTPALRAHRLAQLDAELAKLPGVVDRIARVPA